MDTVFKTSRAQEHPILQTLQHFYVGHLFLRLSQVCVLRHRQNSLCKLYLQTAQHDSLHRTKPSTDNSIQLQLSISISREIDRSINASICFCTYFYLSISIYIYIYVSSIAMVRPHANQWSHVAISFESPSLMVALTSGHHK